MVASYTHHKIAKIRSDGPFSFVHTKLPDDESLLGYVALWKAVLNNALADFIAGKPFIDPEEADAADVELDENDTWEAWLSVDNPDFCILCDYACVDIQEAIEVFYSMRDKNPYTGNRGPIV